MISTWQPTSADGRVREELLLSFDQARAHRVLLVPALFDEANKLRRLTVEVMRRLDADGIDVFLPDLPGTNESLAPLETQTLARWQAAVRDAAKQLNATHIVSFRAGSLLLPDDIPGWAYAAETGASILKTMLRAQILAAREAGVHETRERLLEVGRREGLRLAGWPLGAQMIRELEAAEEQSLASIHTRVTQSEIGGAGLWLRAEPGFDRAQADAAAQRIIEDLSDAHKKP